MAVGSTCPYMDYHDIKGGRGEKRGWKSEKETAISAFAMEFCL